MWKAGIRPLNDLREALPSLASGMSISRAHMVIDQLMSLVGQKRFDEIVYVATQSQSPTGGVVVFHPAKADFATMLLAGWSEKATESAELRDVESTSEWIAENAKAINEVLDPMLYERGVRFLQFATDVVDQGAKPLQEDDRSDHFEAASAWQRSLGFQHIGDLEYQSGCIDEMLQRLGDNEPTGLALRPAANLSAFEQTVERTYGETMDCPAMTQFRSANETLAGYQQTDAYDPSLWFSLDPTAESSDDSEDPIGCLIMGTHRNRQPESSPSETDTIENSESEDVESNGAQSKESSVISELVYMGLVPEARGSGLGKQVIHHAARISKGLGAKRMILAVDETNHPAKNMYHWAGMKPLMREAVWGKRIESE